MYFALSVALVIFLSATPFHINNAEASAKNVSQSKAVKSGKSRHSRKRIRRSGGGGGCQSLSSSTLAQKASPYHDNIASASAKYGVSKDLIKAVITIESCFKSKARGSLGEKGLMQLMPGTARRFSVRDGYNVRQNVHGGARYLSYLLARYDGNAQRAVAAYNAGEGNVRKNGRIPNTGYVSKVMQAYGKFAGGGAPTFVAAKAYTPEPSVSEKPASRQLVKPMKAVFSQPLAAKMKPAAKVQKAAYVTKQAVITKRSAPVSDSALPWADLHTTSGTGNSTAGYRVKAGDTVYEVMRQTGVPVKTIIRLNRLPAPYGIQAGQTLRLR